MASGTNEFEMDEIATITDYIQEEAGMNADIIWGNGTEEGLEDSVRVTVIATGFEGNSDVEKTAKTQANREPAKVVHDLSTEDVPMRKNQPQMEAAEDDMVLITKTPLHTDNKSDNAPQASYQATPEVKEDFTSEVEIKEESFNNEEIKIFTLDGEEKTVNRNEHDITRRKFEESALEINKEFEQKANDRMNKLRDLSRRFSTPNELEELENTPAYIRRGVNLEKSNSDNNVSRYTLDGSDEGLKSNNSFLHDNVD